MDVVWRQEDVQEWCGHKSGEQTFKATIASRLAHLTPRESEVMDMVTTGKSNKEIANSLGVSAKTVEAHRAKVMEKMEAGSLAELVRLVVSSHS